MASHQSSLKAWRVLLTAQAVVLDSIEGCLQDQGELPLTWFEVLARLSGADKGAMRMQDLAHRLVLSRSGVTRLVDRLETAGLIERASCPSDRRGTLAVLTEQGRRVFEDTRPLVDSAVEEQFGRHLADAEARQLETLLTKLLDAHGYAIPHVDECDSPQHAQPAEGLAVEC